MEKSNLKIVFYCPFIASGKGGLERVGIEVANAMVLRNHQVTLAYHNRGDAIPSYPVHDKVSLLPWNEHDLYTLREKIVLLDPDLFFVFNSGWGFKIFCHLIDDTGIPFVVQESTNPERLINIQWAKPLKIPNEQAAWERELVISAAVRIRMVRASFAQTLPDYIKPQVKVFPNAVKQATKLAQPGGFNTERKTIINIGGLKKVKNILPLIHAFNNVAADFPDWDIKVFGLGFNREKEFQQELHNLIKKNELSNRILFMGNSDDIYNEYENAHFHVTTSLNENGPLCVMEAMVHALPSVGFSDCSGTNELIKNEKNGLLTSPVERTSELEKGLRKLMSNPKLRIKLGEQALLDSAIFESSKIYDNWEKLLFEAASYKYTKKRLLQEQVLISKSRALHAYRNRKKIF